MTNYELFDIGVKCAGLGVFVLLLALLLVPLFRPRLDEDEDEHDEIEYDDR